MEKYEKDIISTRNFEADFNAADAQEKKEIRLWMLFTAPFTLLLLCAFFAIEGNFKIAFGVIAFPLLFTFLIAFLTKLKKRKLLNTIKDTEYTVVTAKVIERYEEILPTKYHSGRPNILVFSGYGKFLIPEGVNFSSAKQFSMRETEFFRTSKIGDTFYLVVDNQKNILLAYNTKFFEFKEQK